MSKWKCYCAEHDKTYEDQKYCPECFPHLSTLSSEKHTITSAGSSEYLKLLDDMRELHIKKNAGYAGAGASDPWRNFRACEQFGISAGDGVITRMSDKWSRAQSLWKDKSNEQVGESVEDTLMDLAAYSLILICLLREKPVD